MTDHSLDVWSRACHLVLDQSGRARVHDTRTALNGIALGVEVLRQPGAADRDRLFELMRRDLTDAVDELSGLYALITTLAADELTQLGQAIEWADRVSRPVARRRGVTLYTPGPGAVPRRRVDPHVALALAAAFIETILTAKRATRCIAQVAPEPATLVIESEAAMPDRPRVRSVAEECLEWLGGSVDQARDGEHRRLLVHLPEAA